jgi:hypothetical protein
VTILAVDLAAKYSAACLMADDYTVIDQFDSWQISEDVFIRRLTAPWLMPNFDNDDPPPTSMVIEDLPHGLQYSTLVKTVCRLQGRIYHEMARDYQGRRVLYVAPATWRAHYEGMQRGTGPEIVVPVAERYGYTPPDFTLRAKGNGGKTRAKKVATDYCSAYLIARWAIDVNNEHATFDVPGTSRYDTTVIRKKDFDDQDR